MNKLIDILSEEFGKAFEACGYDTKLGKVTVSNRPDLCEFQCNGAMAGAKMYKKAPIMIANEVLEKLGDSDVFSSVEAVMPGFINIKLSSEFVSDYVNNIFKADSKYLIWPISYNGVIKFMCLDFRNIDIESDEIMRDSSSYKLLFMVKHRLFADILQKFSSHAARLGLSIIQPDIK